MIESSNFSICFFAQIIISDVVKNGEDGDILGLREEVNSRSVSDWIEDWSVNRKRGRRPVRY